MSKMFRTILVSSLLVALSCAHVAYADIRVSPVALYLSDDARNGRVYLYNDGKQDKEVEVGMEFGYPVSDVHGNVTFRFFQTISSDEPSATGWIRVFPEKFTLPAGESQMVVVMASPPPNLPDGEYWARPVLTFRSTSSDNEQASGTAEGSDLVLSMNYRHGSVFTGVNIRAIEAEPALNKVCVTLDLERKGNAAFLGTVECRLRAMNGSIVGRETTEVAVYHSLKRRIEIDVASMHTGEYQAEVALSTNRCGNNPGDILYTPTVLGTAEFSIARASGMDVSTATRPPDGFREETVNDLLPDVRREALPDKTEGHLQSKAIEDALKRVREMETLLTSLLKNLPEGRNN